MSDIIELRDHIPEARYADAAVRLHESLIVALATGDIRDFEPALSEARALIHLNGEEAVVHEDTYSEAAFAVLSLRAGANLAKMAR